MKILLAVAGLVLVVAAPAAAQTTKPTWKEKRAEKQAAGRPNVEEWQQAWRQLSPDDRATLTEAWIGVSEYAKTLTPEQKQSLRDGSMQVAERLKNLTPAQKATLEQKLKQIHAKYEAMTAEEKEAQLSHLADTIDRLKSLSPEQKEQWKARYRRLLGA